jgi:hypothetical protein
MDYLTNTLDPNNIKLFMENVKNNGLSIFKNNNHSSYSFFNIPMITYVFIGITTVSLAFVSLTDTKKDIPKEENEEETPEENEEETPEKNEESPEENEESPEENEEETPQENEEETDRVQKNKGGKHYKKTHKQRKSKVKTYRRHHK